MDYEECSKQSNSNSSNKEFSLKDASLIIGLQPIKVNFNPEEEICYTEKNYKQTKSSHIQSVLTSNNKLKVKIKTHNKSIDVLMKKAYDLRRSNVHFSLKLKNEKEKRNKKEKELQDESTNLERVDDQNKTFKFNLTRMQTARAKTQDKSEQLGRLCNEIIEKLKDMPSKIEKYEEEVESLKIKLIETKDRYMKEICQEGNILIKEEFERDNLKQKSKNLDKVCDGQLKKIEELKKIKGVIMEEREKQQQDFIDIQKKYRYKQQELDRNFNSLQQTLFEKEMTNKVIDKKNKEHEKTRKEIQNMKTNIESLQNTNTSLKEKVKELKIHVSKINFEKKSNYIFSPKRAKKV